MELDQINEYQVFIDHGIAKYDPKSKRVMNAPQGYQKIKVHLVFACKDDGHHKAQGVVGGHLTPDPIDSTYSGVSSLNKILKIFSIPCHTEQHGSLGSRCWQCIPRSHHKRKLYIVAGPEIAELQGQTLVIQKALYGLNFRLDMVTEKP